MNVRTFYWKARVIGPFLQSIRRTLNYNPSMYFAYGNAGDIFAKDLIEYLYELPAKNTKEKSNRLMLIGSIAHSVGVGDLICGIGVKDPTQKIINPSEFNILGVRGPLTYDYFKGQGCDMSQVKFQYDSGFLCQRIVEEKNMTGTHQDVVFVPHYRERERYRHTLPSEMKFVDIDANPFDVIQKILNAKLVYSSSLHGIIFAHALNVPAVLVQPQTEESIFKYKDYYASIGQEFKKPLTSIDEYNFMRDAQSPVVLPFKADRSDFPSVELLKDSGVIV